MSRDEAVKAAQKLAAKYDTQVGRCIWEHSLRDGHIWMMLFAVNDYPSDWACFVSVNELTSGYKLFTTRRPARLAGLD